MTMRVLITGVNGFAGSQPAEYILAKRPQLNGMDPSTGSGYHLEGAVNIGCPEYVTVDELVCWYGLAGGETPTMPWPAEGLLMGFERISQPQNHRLHRLHRYHRFNP